MLLSVGIDPSEMHNEHLVIELQSIHRLNARIATGQVDYSLPISKTYTSGAGSTSFFYRRLQFLYQRHDSLFFEAVFRHLHEAYDFSPKRIWTQPMKDAAEQAGVWNDYIPTRRDRSVSLERLRRNKISLKAKLRKK